MLTRIPLTPPALLARTRNHLRLIVLVWAIFLFLAWLAALPAWRWFDTSLSLAPEGDRLLDGLNIALLKELAHYDRSRTTSIALGSAWTFLLFALIVNPFVAGGILGVLLDRGTLPPGRATVTRRFVQNGVHFYWRFARVMLVAGAVGVILAALAIGALVGLQAAADEQGWERTSLSLDYVTVVVTLLILGLTAIVIDLARIRFTRTDDGRTLGHLAAVLRLLRAQAWPVLKLSAGLGLLLALAALLYTLVASSLTPKSWLPILFAVAWQQLFSLTRTALRVAFIAGEAQLVDATTALHPATASASSDGEAADARPLPPSQPSPQPPPSPVYDLPSSG